MSLVFLLITLLQTVIISGCSASAHLLASIAGTIATVYMYPSGLETVQPCDRTVPRSLGCNSFLIHNETWSTYESRQSADFAILKESLGGLDGASILLLIPTYLFDASGPYGLLPLARFEQVITDIAAAGLHPIIFFGAPEFTWGGSGSGMETRDVIHNATDRAYLFANIGRALALPSVRQFVKIASLYWMGASSFCANGACSEADISYYTSATQSAVKAAAAPGTVYLQHVDGTFWDACWPQPCSMWNYNGYSPSSLNCGLDGIMAESWAQGSLVGGINELFSQGVVKPDTLLLLNDVPNCDLYPPGSGPACSTGSLEGDTTIWFGALNATGIAKSTWSVWDGIDSGLQEPNEYGDVFSNGSALTPKGLLHRAAALSGR